jgi:hypothetical protein
MLGLMLQSNKLFDGSFDWILDDCHWLIAYNT